MLQFPKNYFNEETKYDFTITRTMKCAWAAQLEVLQKIIDICQKYNLTYYAFDGTLLGTVRHKGFIPWDDDIDIAMKREDYMRFLKVAKSELPSEYFVKSVYTDKTYPNPFARVTNSDAIDTSNARLAQYHGCPFIVGVDICPLDYVPQDAKLEKAQKDLLEIIGNILPFIYYVQEERREDEDVQAWQENKETVEQGILTLEEYCNISIDRTCSTENQLRRLFDQICMLYGPQDGSMLTCHEEWVFQENVLFQEEWFGTVQMKFENIMLTVPSGYDQILTKLFGNYMVPVKINDNREYPFYAKQLRILHEMGVWLNVKE